jgi:hypothetical protein
MIPFGSPESGHAMLRLAAAFINQTKSNSSITAIHLTPSSEVNQFNIDEREQKMFAPVLAEAEKQNLKIAKLFKPSQDIIPEVIRMANDANCDLLLVGTSSSIYEGTFLGNLLGFTSKLMEPEKLLRSFSFQQSFFEHGLFDERTQGIIDHSKVPLGIFINKNFNEAKNILLPVTGISDQALFIYARKIIANNNAVITLLDNNNVLDRIPEIKSDIDQMLVNYKEHVFIKHLDAGDINFKQFDLMMVSYHSWKQFAEEKPVWLKEIPSTLIIRP